MSSVALVLNVHDHFDTVKDTIDSAKTYLTNDIAVLIDGVSWDKLSKKEWSVPIVRGLPHGLPKAPCRNVALSMMSVIDLFPDRDWYCYCEYDVIFASPKIKQNLDLAHQLNLDQDKKIWMIGSNGRIDRHQNLSFIEPLIKKKITRGYYLIGCCLFFHRQFIEKLINIEFFDRFLFLTNSFNKGEIPNYFGWDISEHMYPTICREFDGNIGNLSNYDEYGEWHGRHELFPIRWKPDLDENRVLFENASILHPLKNIDGPHRTFHRNKRNLWKQQSDPNRSPPISS